MSNRANAIPESRSAKYALGWALAFGSAHEPCPPICESITGAVRPHLLRALESPGADAVLAHECATTASELPAASQTARCRVPGSDLVVLAARAMQGRRSRPFVRRQPPNATRAG
jgi:hypothetical protein